MTQITGPGRDLANRLSIGFSKFMVCSLIARHSRTYASMQVTRCNHPVGKEFDRREDLIEKRIRSLVAELGEGYGVTLNGDARGAVVYISCPDGRYGDDWGQRGIRGF